MKPFARPTLFPTKSYGVGSRLPLSPGRQHVPPPPPGPTEGLSPVPRRHLPGPAPLSPLRPGRHGGPRCRRSHCLPDGRCPAEPGLQTPFLCCQALLPLAGRPRSHHRGLLKSADALAHSCSGTTHPPASSPFWTSSAWRGLRYHSGALSTLRASGLRTGPHCWNGTVPGYNPLAALALIAYRLSLIAHCAPRPQHPRPVRTPRRFVSPADSFDSAFSQYPRSDRGHCNYR